MNRSREELSLLLFFESRAVDYGGRVNTIHMNEQDMAIAARWTNGGFIKFGRIRAADHNKDGTHWCLLSDGAMVEAQAERRARASRMWSNRIYKTTAENREAVQA